MGMTREEIKSNLEDISARIEVLSGLLNGFYHAALSERSTVFLETEDKDKLRDWCITYYDLLSAAIWESSTALDEQQEILDKCIHYL